MSILLKEIILRILCTCVMSTVALIFAGNGAYRDPVRICCVAFSLISLLSPYKNSIPDISELLQSSSALENRVEYELNNAEDAQIASAVKDTETYIESLIYAQHITCQIEINYTDLENKITITSIIVRGVKKQDCKNVVSDILTSQLGIGKNSIIFEEENNEN